MNEVMMGTEWWNNGVPFAGNVLRYFDEFEDYFFPMNIIGLNLGYNELRVFKNIEFNYVRGMFSE